MSDQDNDPSHSTADPVRELLNQPKLTLEQRQQKRHELLQRQKEARENVQPLQSGHEAPSANFVSAEPDSMTTTALPHTQDPPKAEVRDDLVKQAMEFLNASNVRNADLSKKLSFLEKKGLTKEEINMAQAKIIDGSVAYIPSSSVSSSAEFQPNKTELQPHIITPPPPPPRPAYRLNLVSNQVVVPSAPPMPIWKIATLLLFISYGAFTVTAGIVKIFFAPMLKKLIFHRRSLAGHQTALLKQLTSRLNQLNGLNKPSAETTLADVEGKSSENIADTEESPKPVEALIYITTANTVELESFLTSFEAFSKSRGVPDIKSDILDPLYVGTDTSKIGSKQRTPFEELRETLASFSREVTKQLYSIPYPSFTATGRPWENAYSKLDLVEDRSNNGIQEMKSEIRSLKGMLLNRRNFPMVVNASGSVDGNKSRLNEIQS